MTSRLKDLDDAWRRRMTVCVPCAALVLTGLLFSVPAERVTALRHARVSRPGALRILPQLDIQAPEDEHRLTAAPMRAVPTDFVAVDLSFVPDLELPEDVIPIPIPNISGENPFQLRTADDVQDAARTTGLPVPARSELEVLHVERPVYPRDAVDLGIQGTVEVLLLVDGFGRVNQTFLVGRSRFPMLERAAREAAALYLFRPYRVDGKATPFWVLLPFRFRLVR